MVVGEQLLEYIDTYRKIYDFAETHQNVYVIDWYGISNDHSEYFAEDATHMSMEGIEVFVEEMRIVVTQAFKTEE